MNLPNDIKNTEHNGIIKRHPDGFGFFIPDNSEIPDIYISRDFMTGVMTNDRVKVRVHKESRGDRFRGRVIEVLERGTKKVTGRLHKMSEVMGILRDESFGWGEDLKVPIDRHPQVKEGDWVAVEVSTYPDEFKGFMGEIVAVIGDSMNPVNDNSRILHEHQIPTEFSRACMKLAETFPTEVQEKDIQGRRDLRSQKFITIDGQTAKDFDDAVYVETNDTGFNLFVAIADVSHYVKPGDAIDIDAYERGTSTYLPNFVAPMLPEALSNELCSLKPNVTRLALVAEMQLDFQGQIVKKTFFEAVIQSHARVTYGQAQQVLDGSTPEGFKSVEDVIFRAGDLAKILMAKRFKEGSLNLEIPETTIEVDEAGMPVDILKSERLFSHKLIEELMLITNVAVAEYLIENNMPTLFRIHEKPDRDAVDVLEKFLVQFGFKKTLGGGKLQKKITRALQSFAGQPQEHVLNILTLRTMSQAQYSAENVGHFGLGFDNYSHFTSPIRRYPDLIVHRCVKSIIGIDGYERQKVGELDSAGVVLSACEQRSVKAERQVMSIKKARFASQFVGENFDGMISSVAKFGVFVVLRQYDIDGLLPVEMLGGDYFEFDDENLQLRGKKTGLSYCIGDPVRVQIAGTDIDSGHIDFVLVDQDQENEIVAQQAKRKPSKKRGKTKKNRVGVRKARVSKSRRKS